MFATARQKNAQSVCSNLDHSLFYTAPEVYTKPPLQPKEKKPGQLSPQQLEQYFDKGFLVIPSFFTKEEMEPVIEVYNKSDTDSKFNCVGSYEVPYESMQSVNELVEIIADRLHRGGKIKDKCENAGFYERLILLEQQFPGASILFHKLGYLPVGFRNLWTNERLLNMVEQLIGPDIAGLKILQVKDWGL